ncbi:MAG: PIG-L family deacetylase [Chloroflexales bacterium]
MALHFTHLDKLVAPYGHIVLAPHLDDAALSCGGMIAGLAASGQPVLVVNVCSGSPAPDTSYSPFAKELHARWGLPLAVAVQQRLVEDEMALEILGADGYQLDLLDAIYRMPAPYGSEAGIFGAVTPDDSLAEHLRPRLDALVARFPTAIFYTPLGVGHHVDHQAVYAVAAALAQSGVSVACYEDFPYITRDGALAARLAELGGAELFMPMVTAIDGALSRKIAALEAYQSQLGMLFGDPVAMAQAVTDYAKAVRPEVGTYGERIWVRR